MKNLNQMEVTKQGDQFKKPYSNSTIELFINRKGNQKFLLDEVLKRLLELGCVQSYHRTMKKLEEYFLIGDVDSLPTNPLELIGVIANLKYFFSLLESAYEDEETHVFSFQSQFKDSISIQKEKGFISQMIDDEDFNPEILETLDNLSKLLVDGEIEKLLRDKSEYFPLGKERNFMLCLSAQLGIVSLQIAKFKRERNESE